MTPSEKLRGEIQKSGRTIGSLAKAAGCDAGNLSRFVSGNGGVRLDLGLRLAAILGVDIRDDAEESEIDHARDVMVMEDSEAVDRMIEGFSDHHGCPSDPVVPTKPPRIVNAVPPPAKRAMSPAEVAKRKKLGMPID